MTPQPRYDHREVEQKWQKFWDEKKTFKSTEDTSKPKYYVLDMFPYPSGAGLHVGHVEGYTATDIMARFKRMCGFSVLHPMGWDSFGLPAEQYAIRTGTHPEVTTKENIDNFRRQLKSLGFSYDWDREFATTDADYYKWTQWIFSRLYEKGLAYEAEIPVNYCPTLGTVLANEEVDNGRSKEGGYEVVRLPLRQWILKITAYADRLVSDLDLVDWPESIKNLQINWIGKSEGARVKFQVENTAHVIETYTTCLDTFFGITFIVLAPEHPLVSAITTDENRESVQKYIQEATKKSDLERTEIAKTKSGVPTGAFCIHPATGKRIPIWIADYVLSTYGTGAVQGVPGHCPRDNEFAHTYGIEIIRVLEPIGRSITDDEEQKNLIEEDGIIVNSSSDTLSFNGLSSNEAREKGVVWLEETGNGSRSVQYKLRDWLFSRQRFWGEPIPILHFEDGSKRLLGIDELPLLPPKLVDFKPSGDGQSPLSKVPSWVDIIDPVTGKPAKRETNTMPQWAGSCWYYLRFCDPHNQEEAWSKKNEAYWMPVDLYIGGVEHAVLHLLYSRFWHKVLYDSGLVCHPEPFHSLRNQGLIVARSFKNSSNAYVTPEDTIEKNGEYFHKTTGEKLKSQVEKMSKSKLNGISPDEIIQEYGADALRMYEMFMGPLEKEKIWNTDAVAACKRFISRAYDLVVSPKVSDTDFAESEKLIHRLVDKARHDFELLQFNTVIAKMMEFVNEFSKFETYPRSALKKLAQVLAPISPHVAEELWSKLGESESISYSEFPVADPKFLVDDVVTYVIQVNGKLRGRVDLPKDKEEAEIVSIALDHPNVQRFLDGKEVRKTIFVPNKILNFVV